jgi:CPA2 family monovalent cation:H+ antiporter-2
MDSSLHIVLLLTVGFAFASILGYLSQYAKLSPILGFLLAGFLIGPYSPGYVADPEISEQLAEIGVILMMFGVGLHFHWEDLLNVKNIAIPGAIGQTLTAAAVSALLAHLLGWPWSAGVILGLAVGVASTVVLVRVLSDNNLLNTSQGHIAIGWLIVEDILTVAILILLPTLALAFQGKGLSLYDIASSIGILIGKFFFLALIIFIMGKRIVTYLLFKVARTRSHELLTLTILALTFVIATGSAVLFGTSIALGAFIAGMVIGQTVIRHQASASSLAMKDAFVVIFFLSVGMLFNPMTILENWKIFLAILTVILLVKPLSAILITLLMRHPFKTALTVALALAQIGEFSFILSEEAMKLGLLPHAGYDLIVACAFITISINPLLFNGLGYISELLEQAALPVAEPSSTEILKRVIVVGYGPIGQSVFEILEKEKMSPVLIDQNVDTISSLRDENREAVFGDASHQAILESAKIENAQLFVITSPNVGATIEMIKAARELNPSLPILARARFLADKTVLEDLGVHVICCEEESMEAFQDAIPKMLKTL